MGLFQDYNSVISEIADCYHLRREDSYIVLECIKHAKENTRSVKEAHKLIEIEQKILDYQRLGEIEEGR
tara:strand:+ start:733 stop:939 length:207 start_codon:yes stop_codon:yes gene_type:complete